MKNEMTLYRRLKKKDIKIIREVLLPDETLQSVGDKYGVSRERIRQIFFNNLQMDYHEVRDKLFFYSDRLKCFVCGKQLKAGTARLYKTKTPNPLIYKRYCSRECYKFVLKYDITEPAECQECKHLFFRYRNWKSMKGKYYLGKYCSVSCYVKRMVAEGNWSLNRRDRVNKNPFVAKECIGCGKVYTTKRPQAEKQKYCSLECYIRSRQVKLKCKNCGKIFVIARKKSKNRKFCSMKCFDNYRKY